MGSFRYDFSGWATKNDLRCSDGRTIRKDAFKEDDSKVVPLVWNHDHANPTNVLGHALLENRAEGVYAFCAFNDTEAGMTGKSLVQHGDVTALSIYANQLKQHGGDVIHGAIREVSLVLAGANPGAFIDTILEHADGADGEAIIFTGCELDLEHSVKLGDEDPQPKKKTRKPKAVDEEELVHAEDTEDEEDAPDGDETVEDVFNTLSEKQKTVVYALIGKALEDAKGGSAEHSAMIDDYELAHADVPGGDGETVADVFDTLNEKQKTVVYALIGQALEDEGKTDEKETEGETEMKHNVFDGSAEETNDVLTHADMSEILKDAKRVGSLKETLSRHGIDYISHADDDPDPYGITNIDYLFPDAKAINRLPDWIKREDSWVNKVIGGAHHSPFARIKSTTMNITADEARARGYVKGNKKVEEVMVAGKRTTTPQTIYKKAKLDRDDIIDITDFDVVAFQKGEMRGMLNEEVARAALIGDGRTALDDDKIDPTHVRPIWTDDSLYTINKVVTVGSSATEGEIAKAFIRACVKARKDYKGSGNPTLFTTEDVLTDCLLLEDLNGRVIYDTEEKLRTALRVKEIVTVPVMENQSRTVDAVERDLMGIIVNMADYTFGADKGGEVSMFEDFDIDFNQEKYLMETRVSGALTKPYSAIAVELVTTNP